MNTNNLSRNLYELRRINNLSQEEMAEKLYVSRQAISKWERGKGYPDITILPSIARVLDCSVSDFFDNSRA